MWIPDMSKVLNPEKKGPKPSKEVQLFKSTVPFTLKEIVNKEENVLTEGDLTLFKSEATGDVRVAIANVTWKVKPTDHVMASVFTETHAPSYIFANIEGTEKFYCAVGPTGASKEEIEQLEVVLKEVAVYHVSERKQTGPMPMNLGEMFKKAQEDTQMLMQQAGNFFQGKKTEPAPQT